MGANGFDKWSHSNYGLLGRGFDLTASNSGCSSVWSEFSAWNRDAGGSNPPAPIKKENKMIEGK